MATRCRLSWKRPRSRNFWQAGVRMRACPSAAKGPRLNISRPSVVQEDQAAVAYTHKLYNSATTTKTRSIRRAVYGRTPEYCLATHSRNLQPCCRLVETYVRHSRHRPGLLPLSGPQDPTRPLLRNPPSAQSQMGPAPCRGTRVGNFVLRLQLDRVQHVAPGASAARVSLQPAQS